MSILLYGCGGIGVVAAEVAIENGLHVDAFLDDDERKTSFAGIDVFTPTSPAGRDRIDEVDSIVICISDSALRKSLHAEYAHRTAILVHPSAEISPTARVGKGSLVFMGSKVQTNAEVGEAVILNTGASIDHDVRVANFAHIGPGTVLCGYVEVGEGANIGAGAVIIPGMKIGAWSIVGAGTVVIADVPPHSTVVGSPARVVKMRESRPLVR